MPRKSLRERLEAKINNSAGPDACWPWKDIDWHHQYGKIRDNNNILQRAHRMVWQEFIGPIPEGMEVLHSCDHPGCCNPTHLFLGSQVQNVADMDKKGRRGILIGFDDPQSLSREKVDEIRSLLLNLELTCENVGDLTGVSLQTVARIAKGQIYGLGPVPGRKFYSFATKIQIEEVKALLAQCLPQRIIAERVGISQMAVSRISRGLTYN